MDDSRTRIVIYYSIWATICAAVAGLIVALIHTWFFSYNPGRSAVIETLFSGAVAAVGIAAAQGALALVTGSLLARLGRTLQFTLLLGLVIGLFDFLMYFLPSIIALARSKRDIVGIVLLNSGGSPIWRSSSP